MSFFIVLVAAMFAGASGTPGTSKSPSNAQKDVQNWFNKVGQEIIHGKLEESTKAAAQAMEKWNVAQRLYGLCGHWHLSQDSMFEDYSNKLACYFIVSFVHETDKYVKIVDKTPPINVDRLKIAIEGTNYDSNLQTALEKIIPIAVDFAQYAYGKLDVDQRKDAILAACSKVEAGTTLYRLCGFVKLEMES